MSTSGLCIGGPRDGQMAVCEGRVMRAFEQVPMTHRYATVPLEATEIERVHDYAHYEFFGVGFFVPLDWDGNPDDLVKRLVQHYRPEVLLR